MLSEQRGRCPDDGFVDGVGQLLPRQSLLKAGKGYFSVTSSRFMAFILRLQASSRRPRWESRRVRDHSGSPRRGAEQRCPATHPDVLHELLATFIHPLMGAEADTVCGANYGQRSTERTNQPRAIGIANSTSGQALWIWRSPGCGDA